MKTNFTPLYNRLILIVVFSLLCFVHSFSQNTRLWATYYGGTGLDNSHSIATDAAGNVYLVGFTDSPNDIASGGFQNTPGGGYDAIIVKFDPAGNRLWGTYYGGSTDDYGLSVTVDATGNVYCAGRTRSTTNIASGGFQNTYGGGQYDAFLVKFDANGNRLWATYYGGTNDEGLFGYGCGVTTDATGNVYLAGYTASTTNIASGGFQNVFGGGVRDAFLVKFDANGVRLWATYYGNTGSEEAYSAATDAGGNVYLSGLTSSAAGIASGGFSNVYAGGAVDAFLVKFDASGNRLWGTYYGGTANDIGTSVITDITGNIYLAGLTGSAASIASGGFQNSYGGGTWDAFLVKFNPAGNRIWSSYYGGTADEEIYWDGLASDIDENVYLAGRTYSANTGSVIASGGFQNNLAGTQNMFLVKFDAEGNRLCSSYYGQSHEEHASVAVDKLGHAYLAGSTTSTSGIASGGFQNSYGGALGGDAFLVKFNACFNTVNVTATSTNIPCYGQCVGTATADAVDGTLPYTYTWSTTPPQTTQTATGLCEGTYTVTVSDAILTTATAIVTITQPAILNANITSTAISCGINNGTAIVIPSGGMPTYTYSWSPSGGTDSTATGLSAGSYTAIVTDANGCKQTATVVLANSSIPTISVGPDLVLSCTITTGIITASSTTIGVNYFWTGPVVSGATNDTATVDTPGTYTVTVIDPSSGCTNTRTVEVINDALAISIGPNVTLSCATTSGIITASSLTTGVNYSWTGPVVSGATNDTAVVNTAGTYTVTVSDPITGCSNTATVTVSINSSNTSSSQTVTICYGKNYTLPGGTTVTLAGVYMNTIPNAQGCDSTITTILLVLPNSASLQNKTVCKNEGYTLSNGMTVYTSGVYKDTILSAKGCDSIITTNVTVNNSPTASVSPAITITLGDAATLTASGFGTYQWSPGSGLNVTLGAAVIAKPVETTTYCVVVTNLNNCADTACVIVTVDKCTSVEKLKVPNAFSPNKDGINDEFCLLGWDACLASFQILIYDRWGEQVFKSNDPNFCWDGNYLNKIAEAQVFVYYIQATFLNIDKSFVKRGNISLIQ